MSQDNQGRTDRESIEVSEKTLNRYEKKKEEMDAAEPHLPDMTNDQFVKTLLDTVDAVENGLYEVSDSAQQRLPQKSPPK